MCDIAVTETNLGANQIWQTQAAHAAHTLVRSLMALGTDVHPKVQRCFRNFDNGAYCQKFASLESFFTLL